MKNKKLAIYLAGSIQKAHEPANESRWTEADRALLREQLPNFEISFLNPDHRTDDLSDCESVFGRDLLQVFSSNLVFVDARDRRGLGVGAEMMWAKINEIPILTWAPIDSHYKKKVGHILGVPISNYVHPFVGSLSDGIVPDLKEGAKWIREVLFGGSFKAKDLSFVRSTLRYYLDTQFKNDLPMRELIAQNQMLKSRLETLQKL